MDFAASVLCQATHHERHVQAVPRAGKGGIRRGEFSAVIAAVEPFVILVMNRCHFAGAICFARCVPAR